jgi:hypothetical protein
MSSRVNSRKRQPRRSVGENNSSRLKVYSMMLVCVLVLVSGFFFAARQHFSSIDFGIRNSRLRRQLDDLETEKRRLLLAREVSLSPAEIKKAAKKFGLSESAADGTQLASAAKDAKPATAVPASITRTSGDAGPAYSVVTAAYMVNSSKSPNVEKPVKRDTAEKDKAEGSPIAAVVSTR